MTIQNKLFKAITSVFNTTSDLADLKAYLNDVFKEHSGNGLRPSKLDNYFSDSIGANNPNIVAALTENHIDNIDALHSFIYKNMKEDFSDISFEFSVDANYSFSFYVPIIDFKVKNNEDIELDYQAILDITMMFTDNKVTTVHTLYLYDVEESNYIEIPYDWDLEQSDLTYILEEYLKVGHVTFKKPNEKILKLMPFSTSGNFNDSQFVVDSSSLIATHISRYLFDNTNKKPKMLYSNMTSNDTHDTYHAYELVF
jgi:hypothetical protein